MRILIIEDEYNLADAIATRLKKESYLTDISISGEEGLYLALENIYDLIILDVMLPYKNGFDILKELRSKGITSKIIMLTAKSTLEDKLTGLENGANDYLTKPFHIDELVARINIQLKNISSPKKNLLSFGDLELDLSSLTLTCTKTKSTVTLVKKEYQLLEYFMNNPNQILTKEQLYDKVWGLESTIESNNLEAYLSFIRKKLKAIDSKVNIKSIRNLGYRMDDNHE